MATNFTLAVTSDPQFAWYDNILPKNLKNESTNKEGSQVYENAHRQISMQYLDIIQRLNSPINNSSPLKAVMVNGDLTAYGHSYQLEYYKQSIKIFEEKQIPVYSGLGNHDYFNNFHDCPSNRYYMIEYMFETIASKQLLALTKGEYFSFDASKPDLNYDKYTGSMSYSYEIEGVQFIQLHNNPYFIVPDLNNTLEKFIAALPWLESVLQRANDNKKPIIVLMHQFPIDRESYMNFEVNDKYARPELYMNYTVEQANDVLAKMFNDHKVSAVFAGHVHADCCRINPVIMRGGVSTQYPFTANPDHIVSLDAPLFRSGAAGTQQYFTVDFDLNQNKCKLTTKQSILESYSQPNLSSPNIFDTGYKDLNNYEFKLLS